MQQNLEGMLIFASSFSNLYAAMSEQQNCSAERYLLPTECIYRLELYPTSLSEWIVAYYCITLKQVMTLAGPFGLTL